MHETHATDRAVVRKLRMRLKELLMLGATIYIRRGTISKEREDVYAREKVIFPVASLVTRKQEEILMNLNRRRYRQ